MNLIIALVIGGIVGWLASIVMKSNARMGIVANVIIGVLGGALGHYIAGLLGITAVGIGAWLVSLGGAILLIGGLRAVGLLKKG